jgi:hypothetical protein
MCWRERARAELDELVSRLDKLDEYIESEAYSELSEWHRTALGIQREYMSLYADTLESRIRAEDR